MRTSHLRWRLLLIPAVLVVATSGPLRAEAKGDEVLDVQKESGPYMVVARTFRGPEAEKHARTLASELRTNHKLSAYLLRSDDEQFSQPRDRTVANAEVVVLVLVGDAKTLTRPKQSSNVWDSDPPPMSPRHARQARPETGRPHHQSARPDLKAQPLIQSKANETWCESSG